MITKLFKTNSFFKFFKKDDKVANRLELGDFKDSNIKSDNKKPFLKSLVPLQNLKAKNR